MPADLAGKSGVLDVADAAANASGYRGSYRRPADTGSTSHNGSIMRSFTPRPGPRRRGPCRGVHTLGLPGATPRWNRTRFCSLGAARPRLRGRLCRQRPGGTSPPLSFRCRPLAARPPAGAGRVGRAYGASRSALTGRGLCGQSPRPVFAGCHMSRGTPAPGAKGSVRNGAKLVMLFKLPTCAIAMG